MAAYVDHDHDTKQVRGLLCSDCNIIEGQIRDTGLSYCEWVNNFEKYQTAA